MNLVSRSLKILSRLRFFVLYVFLFLSCSLSAVAQAVWTNGAGDGNWANGANWMSGSPPTAGQTITFNAGTYTISSGIPNILFGQITASAPNITFTQVGGILRTTRWNFTGNVATFAAGMTLQLEAGPGTNFNNTCNFAGKLIIQTGHNAVVAASGYLNILSGGEIEIQGSGSITSNSPTYSSGSKLTYTGSSAKVIGFEFPVTPLTGVAVTIDNSAGVTNSAVRTISGGTLLVKDGRTLTLTSGLNINMSGKVQIDGSPLLSGAAIIQYGGPLDTLEYIGSNNFTIDGQEVSGAGPMNGTILVNKPGSVVNGVAGTLQVNGSFLLNQGTWNVNAGGRLLYAGSGATYYTTTSGTTMNVATGGVLELGPNRTLTNNGTLNVAGGASCILNDVATVQGASAINYTAPTSILRYFGSGNKTTTPQELPASMPGGVMIDNSSSVNLSSSTSVMGSVTVGSIKLGVLSTGSQALTLNANSLIYTGGFQVGLNGVLRVMNGVNVTSQIPNTLFTVLNGGTVQLDGSGAVITTATITYNPGSNLLYTGSGNRTVTSGEMPASGSINCNVGVSKTAGTYLDLPASASNVITLNNPATLSLTSGTVRAGRGVRSILFVQNSNFAAVTSASGFVEGPLQRTIVSSPNVYTFPSGDGGQNLPLAIVNPSMMTPAVIVVESTSGNCGGTAGRNLSSLSTTEFWRVKLASGGPLINGQVAVLRAGGWSSPAAIGMADTITTRPYNSVGGTLVTNGLVSNPIDMTQWGSAQRHFAVGATALPVKAAFGYQLSLNGTNQEAVAPANAVYDALTSFTVEALVRPTWTPGTPSGDPCIFSLGDAAGTNFSLHVGKLYAAIKVGNSTTTRLSVVPAGTFGRNRYSHVAAVYNGSVLTYYVDGKLVGSENISLTFASGKALHIGSKSGVNEFWQGDIDEVRLWNTALPQNVIAAWKGLEVTASHPNVASANHIGYWRFNDGYPQSAVDLSPTANNAAFVNGPIVWAVGSTSASSIATPSGTSIGQLFATKVGGGALTYSLIGANGGSTMATVSVSAFGSVSYTPNVRANLDDADYIAYRVSDGTNVSTATVEVRFSPNLQATAQFVSHNRATQITTANLAGGVSPLTAAWLPVVGGLAPTTVTNPTVTLTTDATTTLQIADGFGNTASANVPLLLKPLTLAYSRISTTASTGLPSSIISGSSFDFQYGIFDIRTGSLDTASATVVMTILPTAGGTGQFSVDGVPVTANGNYVRTFIDRDRIRENPFTINWLNAPIAGGSTQAVVTLFRTSGTPILPVSKTITITSSATLPVITSFAPDSTGAGKTVVITGVNFVGVTQVRFGGVPAQSYVVDSPTQITAVVGAAGASGSVGVLAAGGAATSTQNFTFVPAPQVTSFTPTMGFSGSVVTITGQNFIAPATVSFGGVSSPNVNVISPTQILAEVGNGASGVVSVQNVGGTGASLSSFSFIGAPTITSITPAQGGARTVITVRGADFQSIDSVLIGSVALTGSNGIATQISPTEVRITLDTVPLSGRITLYMISGSAVSPTSFTFISPPKIDSIIPAAGGAGTQVRLVGRNFVNVDTVRFGAVNITGFMALSTTAITFTMPPQMQSSTSAILVSALGGRDSSKATFQYVLPPQITAFTPAAGAGAWVQVTGANLVGVTSMIFGGVQADSVENVSPQLVRAKISSKGASGKVEVIAAGGTAKSQQDFRFLLAPTIIGFTPPSGATGATVEITGTEFVNVSGVSIGGVSAANFSVASDTRIVATLSNNATSGTIRVTTLQGQAESASAFRVIIALGPPPSILSFTPPSGEAGVEVFVSGQNLANTGLVEFGGITAASFRIISPTLVAAIVPMGATSGSVRITTPNGIAASVAAFRFIAPSDGGAGFTPLQRDSSILVRLYSLTGGGAWFNERNWATDVPVSSWAGVTVENGQITRLVLANNALLGTIPSFIAELSALKVLDLSGNQLSGTISSSIATIKTLEILRLRGNQFTGALPPLTALTNLQVLDVGNNRLVGDIPRSLCALPNLREVRLDSNGFSGVIPSCIGALQKVETLNLSENLLSDTIPPEIGSMTALRELSLSGNQLTGAIPQTLGTQATVVLAAALSGQFDPKSSTSLQALPNLQRLDMSRNRLTGIIPASLGQCVQLRSLSLAQNRLTGNIPQSFGNLVALQSLDASRNQLSGTLPTFWGNLRQLQTLSFRSNAITGAVPLEIGRLSALTTMWLDSNALESLTDSVQVLGSLRRFSVANNRLKTLPALRRTSGVGFDSVNVAGNALTFESLERNFTGARVAVYSPQDSVLSRVDTTVRVFLPFRVSSAVPGIATTYQWYKDGRVLAETTDSVLSLTRLVRADTGVYTCYVRSPLARDLTLIRRTVRVSALPPQAPSERPALVTPQNAAQSVSITPTLVWTATALTSSYDVEISPTSDFSSPSTLRLIAADPLRPRLTLTSAQARENLTTYYWRVRAVSEGLPGAWSEVGRFTTVPAGRTVNVETVSFGRVVLRRSSSQLITVQNLSGVAIIIQTVRLLEPTNQSAGQFVLTPLSSPVPLEPDSAITVPVRFTPGAVGEQVATVVVGYTVASSGTNIPTELTFANVLSGTGGALTFAGTEVDFGTRIAGLTKTESIQITNVGSAAMTIQPIPKSFSDDTARVKFGLSDALTGSLTLQQNQSLPVYLSCALTKSTDSGIVRGGMRFVGQFTTSGGILFDTLLVPMKVNVIQPKSTDVQMTPKLVSEQQGVAPGGIAVLAVRLKAIDYKDRGKDSLTKDLSTLFSASKQPVFTAEITLNRQVLIPADDETSLQSPRTNGDLVTYTIPQTLWDPSATGSVFKRLRCRVVAGNTDTTVLKMTSFVWDTTKSETNAGIIQVIVREDTSAAERFVAGISQAGGKRLITAVTTAMLSVMQPNPITVSGTIAFTLFEQSAVQLVVVDAFGRVVKNLVAGVYAKGEHLAQMRVEDLPTGAYFVVLRTAEAVLTEQVQVRR